MCLLHGSASSGEVGTEFPAGNAGYGELGGRETPDAKLLQSIFADAKIFPKAVTRRLVW